MANFNKSLEYIVIIDVTCGIVMESFRTISKRRQKSYRGGSYQMMLSGDGGIGGYLIQASSVMSNIRLKGKVFGKNIQINGVMVNVKRPLVMVLIVINIVFLFTVALLAFHYVL